MDLTQLSAIELRQKLMNKEVSSVEIVKSHLDKIEKTESSIGAFITTNGEEALKNAEVIDKKIANGEKLGSLAGIPIGIKDNVVTNGIATTCGSKMLEDFVPPYDATVIEKIKGQDGIIIGKTNMDEFAMGSSTETSYFKVTKNPHDLERVPGGSSGGSAAAVASHEVPLSLGSETGGSVREPASFCGVVGIKPTYGLVSRYGLIAFASSLDQIGTFGRNVEDAALMLNAITGFDRKDSTSVSKEVADYTNATVEGIKGMRLALPKEYFGEGIDKNIKEKVYNAVKVLEGLGAKVEETSLPYTDYALACYYLISTSEASSNLSRLDGVRYGHRT